MMSKNPISVHIDDISYTMFGMSRGTALNKGICVRCKNTVASTDFLDQVSANEYQISALCQECQDEIFEV